MATARSRPAGTPPAGGDHPPARRRSSFFGDLRVVWAERQFRKLFATRLISQTGDGLFTAGLGGFVFFNSTNFPNPAAGAAAFAVLYLPYSLVGPFAGVFIDRWSRRQILMWSVLIRAAFVGLTAALVAGGALGVPLFVTVLIVLGVDRFFQASLSAALPHVVPGDKLVMANAVAPTAGGILSAVGGLAALAVHVALHGGRGEYAATLLAAGLLYLGSGLAAATIPRGLLGPGQREKAAHSGRIGAEMAEVARGLAAGAKYITSRRGAAGALAATAGNRIFYGILLLMSILLWRNYFYASESANAALSRYGVLTLVVAVGYGSAAFVTPVATRRLSKRAWIAVLLALGALITAALGTPFAEPAFVVLGFFLGLIGQGIAIATTTILQEQVSDEFRGRAFAFYDMFFNALFVGGAAVAALFMPATGRSVALMIAIAIGYAVVAAAYWLASREGGTSQGPAAAAGPVS